MRVSGGKGVGDAKGETMNATLDGSEVIVKKLATMVFESWAEATASGINWKGWTTPSHPGYSSAGRALASMTNKRWAAGWDEGQQLAAYKASNGRWYPLYAT